MKYLPLLIMTTVCYINLNFKFKSANDCTFKCDTVFCKFKIIYIEKSSINSTLNKDSQSLLLVKNYSKNEKLKDDFYVVIVQNNKLKQNHKYKGILVITYIENDETKKILASSSRGYKYLKTSPDYFMTFYPNIQDKRKLPLPLISNP